MSKATVYAAPPFPRLRWEHLWQGEIVLPAWAGFQSRQGAYGGRDALGPSDGRVRLSVDTGSQDPPSKEQARAFSTLVDDQEGVRDAVLLGLFKQYPEWRAEWKELLDDDEFEEVMPPVGDPMGLRTVLGLHSVHVLPVSWDGMAYTGFELGCGWDEEQGLGVMMHGRRVVEVGNADCSFYEWKAEADVERQKVGGS